MDLSRVRVAGKSIRSTLQRYFRRDNLHPPTPPCWLCTSGRCRPRPQWARAGWLGPLAERPRCLLSVDNYTCCRISRRHCRTTGAAKHEVGDAALPSCSSTIALDAGVLHGAPLTQLATACPADFFDAKSRLLKFFPSANIRNVSIVAHVDHGKTTLTDALLRKSELLPVSGAVGTFTDRLRVERERGITIKAQTCSIFLKRRRRTHTRVLPTGGSSLSCNDTDEVFLINLIDTPGHVDFQYEVSRSLSASEGAVLLVDVNQGVEAQTMAQFFAALEHHLVIIPVMTKMDLVMSSSTVARAVSQLEDSTGLLQQEVVFTSAKEKKGLEALLQAVVDRVAPPRGLCGLSDTRQLPVGRPDTEERRRAEQALVPLRALLFDCWTAECSGMGLGSGGGASSLPPPRVTLQTGGIYCLVRIVDGTVTPGTVVTFFHSRKRYEVRQVGIIHPELFPTAALTTGMVGYLFLEGLCKADVRLGDTLCTTPTKQHRLVNSATPSPAEPLPWVACETEAHHAMRNFHAVEPIPGFRPVRPVVFAGFYPDEGDFVEGLRKVVDLLCVNDPSVTVEPLQCQALGAGLQLGFLGLLHMQVFKDRLLAEFGQSVLVTPPQVQYMHVDPGDNPDDPLHRKPLTLHNWRWPHEGAGTYLEPMVHATVITPKDYFNAINAAALSTFRGVQKEMRVVDDARMLARYRMPLADLARGFFSVVKSASRGYATLDYDSPEYEPADLVRVDIVVNKAKLSALSLICPRQEAHAHGRRILAALKENFNRTAIDIPLQALLGNKIIARETVKAYRKDVTAKIHAGDITRKQKKWNDQKKGKERMARRSFGAVTLDQNVLAAVMGATFVR